MGFSHVLSAPPFRPGGRGDLFLTADHERLHPALAAEEVQADAAIAALARDCAESGLALLLDVVVDRVADDLRTQGFPSDCFAVPRGADVIDPRNIEERDALVARFDDAACADALAGWWAKRLARLAAAGVAGFRCLRPAAVPAEVWRRVIGEVRAVHGECLFIADTPGLAWDEARRLSGCGFDYLTSSAAWWDGRAEWLLLEHEALRPVAPLIAYPEQPFGKRAAAGGAARRALGVAAATGAGLLVPMGFEHGATAPLDPVRARPAAEATGGDDRTAAIADVNRMLARGEFIGRDDALHPQSAPGAPVTAILRTDSADARRAARAALILVNPDVSRPAAFDMRAIGSLPIGLAAFRDPARGDIAVPPDGSITLEPGEVRLLAAAPSVPVTKVPAPQVAQASAAPRIVIDAVAPSVDGGRFAVKRLVGETVTVEADIFMDGHDVLAASLHWRAADEKGWRSVPMRRLLNDRWEAAFTPTRIGRHVFTIEAWRDAYGSWRSEVEKKHAAGKPVTLDLMEGIAHLRKAAEGRRDRAARALLRILDRLGPSDDERREGLLTDEVGDLAAACEPKQFLVRHPVELPVAVERRAAGFASWYELFPRSQTDDPGRHGTFDDVIARLPAIRDMGFDVLYFPPIHPIGATNRKGRNNALTAAPDEPGSPYAIGSPDGGHDAIHPELGSFADFRRLREAAAAHGIELALDFAIQCSPDHPWLKEHRGWFAWRADGSLRYAENPPKTYEDIVNVDFYAQEALPELWLALRDVVALWAEEGVRLFRVDNPHTKPLPFWEWLIADISRRYPDVVFLSEAFTRPKMMYRLAKVGFSQSYTYFTWRNEKAEIAEYLTELTTTAPRDYFRPHFFVNTPDINPFFLQRSGRPGFLIRAALAATLSGLWGIYSGFELCEAEALPGREEYLDSEKYEIRPRDWNAPGNIVAEITRLNRIRKVNPALHSHLGLTFYNAFDDAVLYFGKATPSRDNTVLVAISLDPYAARAFSFELPLWEWGLPDDGALHVEDLVNDRSFVAAGKVQQMTLAPHQPFAIWRVRPAGEA